jgi:hypothetical protein
MGLMTTIGWTVKGWRWAYACACAAALAWAGVAASARADGVGQAAVTGQAPGPTLDSASLVQCSTAAAASERAASFGGEMMALTGVTRMGMRIELLERTPGEAGYRPVLAPGVGAWHYADPGVKAYKHIEQFTNLTAPANYRALITFRWDGPHGRAVKHDERRSPRCQEPAPAPPVPEAPLE